MAPPCHLPVAVDGSRTPKCPLICVASSEATRSEIVPSLLLWRGGTPGCYGVSLTTSPLVKFAQLVSPGPSPILGSAEDGVGWDFSLPREPLHRLPVNG